ncbi:hypothetical protein NX80_002185 [Xanthomonas vasicola pv. arecae]|nr:hypothetical protein NX80_002185 [Xanthomonas vasicola pv. arecae]TWQ32618.1 hypothetical protein FQJ99_21695 [Xanthomonas vasicola]TWQ76423.1 hypothetical protein FQJ86_02260 [Xanthomonas vasicola]
MKAFVSTPIERIGCLRCHHMHGIAAFEKRVGTCTSRVAWATAGRLAQDCLAGGCNAVAAAAREGWQRQ